MLPQFDLEICTYMYKRLISSQMVSFSLFIYCEPVTSLLIFTHLLKKFLITNWFKLYFTVRKTVKKELGSKLIY